MTLGQIRKGNTLAVVKELTSSAAAFSGTAFPSADDHSPLKTDLSSSPQLNSVLRPKAAAAYTGLAESTLAKGRLYGWGPPFVRLGLRLVGYRLNDLDAWLSSRARTSTSDKGVSA
jgi:predicted DNA-binding transcriptional regulator AlpA